ncbi:MAG TPA: SIMPL domain-containing protein [Thermoanaerobaculia bacterium]|nr:SIMPL domain-containing protein [Thermoanaerobaculia bacterium]
MERTNGGSRGVVWAGVFVFAGLALAGYFVGQGVERLRSAVRTVTVKGLVEKEVKADQAIWTLNLRRASRDLEEARARIGTDRDAAFAFLRKLGFDEAEIERAPIRTIDKLAREYGQPQGNDPLRYILTTALVVKTPKIELVRSAVGQTDELLKAGVVLDGGEGGPANPRYAVSAFNDLRPQLLADATKNARAMAQQFAADSGSRVGRIQSANQGMIQIFGSDGNDESGPFSPTSTPVKKIRVVSTFEFALE